MAKYEVDYFELPAKDAGTAGDFFAKAFGWTLKSYGPSYTELSESGILGGLNGDAGDQPKAPLIGIRTDDIAAAEAAVTAAGGIITRPTYDFPGGKRFYFREPGGSEMMVYMPTE
jgi:predicted enzyme related to lactoylglutathione lyase